MNLKSVLIVVKSLIYCSFIKVFYCRNFRFSVSNLLNTGVHFDFSRKASVKIGKRFSCRRNVQIATTDNSLLEIGDDVFINTNSVIACHKHIVIGDNVKFGPGVYIYDHDHTYSEGKITHEYSSSDIVIDDDVWIGANCIILRDTHIGKKCVFGAGCIIKGDYCDESFVVQKRESTIKRFEEFSN